MVSSAPQLPVECLRFVQAPMVGTSDLPFRLMTARWGCTLTYTEMAHSTKLLDDQDYRDSFLRDLQLGKAVSLLRDADGDGDGRRRPVPVVAQLAGNDPDELVQSGRLLLGLVDAVELNLGCPQQRAQDGHYGGYLINNHDLPLVSSLISALSTTLPLPIHSKTRLPSPNLPFSTLITTLAASGSSTITLHARPLGAPQRRRASKGLDTTKVGEVKRVLEEGGWTTTNVVGNGGVRKFGDVERLTKEERVEGWMVGEELARNPRFFTESEGFVNPLHLGTEYLSLVDDFPPNVVPLPNVKRHLKNFVEEDVTFSRSRFYKPFLRDLTAAVDYSEVKAVHEILREEWTPPPDRYLT